MPRILQMLFSRCTDPSRELEFNRWYTHTHLPDLARVPGFVSARRFANALPSPGAAPYMAVYECEADCALVVLRDLTVLALEAFDRGRHIDCIEGLSGGFQPTGAQWQEIDAAALEPLAAHDYPPAPPAIRRYMASEIERLTEAAEADRRARWG